MDQNVVLSPQLRTQHLIQHRSVGVGLGWIIVIPLMLTIIGILLAYPLMLIFGKISTSSASSGLVDEANTKFRAFIGRPAKYFDVAVCGYGKKLSQISASGMAYADGRLYVLEEGVAAEIPWDDIRTWNWNIDGANQTQLFGKPDLGSQIQVAHSNQDARAVAHRASGFTLTTADIEKPEWRFQTADEKVLKKWMEVLTQMNEGRIPRA